MISISIVSHGQGDLVSKLLADLADFLDSPEFEVVLTRNIPERFPLSVGDYPFPLKVVDNSAPKGFGANHNAAFRLAQGAHFCVVNPDIRLLENPFPVLLEEIEQRQAAVAAPAVISPSGQMEDSVRHFPTLLSLAGKALRVSDGRYAFSLRDETFAVDWVAGMLMLFRSEDYRAVDGFDERFFLYYEDVDICTRLWKAGRPVVACPPAQVVHDARRTSRRNVRYMRWHVASMLLYLGKHWMRLPSTDGR